MQPLRVSFTLYSAGSPSIFADIDRLKAEKVGLTPTDVFSTLQFYLGSQYVNDFNYLGRTYQVIAQGDEEFRKTAEDIARLKVRNATGQMVPMGTVVNFRDDTAPYRVPRYNLYPAAEIMGAAAPGVASGTAMKRIAELAKEVLPTGISFEWTDLRASAGTAKHTDTRDLRRFRVVRVPRPRGAIRELEITAIDRADPPYVPTGLVDRPKL